MPDFLTSCGVTQARAPLVIASLFAAFVPLEARAHGLIESPPSRNWMCGATTKPDQANGANAKYPECADAFETDRNGGYQFMSVLTTAPDARARSRRTSAASTARRGTAVPRPGMRLSRGRPRR